MDPEEHVLREILRARSILYGAGNQREHQILVSLDELLKGAFVASTAAFDELGLVSGLHLVIVLEHVGGEIVSDRTPKHE